LTFVAPQQRNITRRDRKAAEILDRIVQLRSDLVTQYSDLPGLRPKELALLSASGTGSGQDDLQEFYKRFEKVKDFHRKNPGMNARQFINELDDLVRSDGLQSVQVDDDEEAIVVDRELATNQSQLKLTLIIALDSVFSGEEAYGKHLDLLLSHSQYLNLRGANR
jgi:splicing factor 3A subunit 3